MTSNVASDLIQEMARRDSEDEDKLKDRLMGPCVRPSAPSS